MAKIPFPPGVMITRSDLEMVHPGQVVPRSIYGAGSQVLGRGPGHWRGRLEIAETDRCSDDQRRAVEAFLSRLRGALNTFEAPIERASSGSLAAGTKLTVSMAALSSGVLTVTVTGAAEGLLTGDYVSIGDRLYQLTSDHQGSQFTVEPPAVPTAPAAGQAVVWENVTCLARMAGEDGAGGGWTPDFGGPWVLDWIEVT